MYDQFKYILYEEYGNIGWISLNRPKKLNALNYPLLTEIIKILENLKKRKDILVIVIMGKGKAFSSGDDLVSMGPEGPRFRPLDDGSKLPHHKVFQLIREINKPIIAMIHGYCLGAGFELALACDIRLASTNLIIGDHRAQRAQCVMSGASWLLPRIIGFGRASEIILTGRDLDAKEALKIGLVTEVFNEIGFSEQALAYINKIAKLPTKCLGYNKMMMNYSQVNSFFPSLNYEFKLYCKNIATHDFGEGLRSFKEKREPNFIGR
jgi:2-(1,2-epoxy-1,2-dihydrophenyl)acetyl-CoA isomerase